LALELRAVGFDWDFAPVLDVDTNPKNPVIGDRALHRDASEVARLGVALARGLESGGGASCAEHFPGPRGTPPDSPLPRTRTPPGPASLTTLSGFATSSWCRFALMPQRVWLR